MIAKRSLSSETADSVVDVFEAVKRAFIRQGLVRQVQHIAVPKPAKARPKKLREIAAQSHDVLFRISSVFPFVLFTDTVSLDREKLTIVYRYFFGTSKVVTLPIPDIVNVEVTTGPFFGSLHVTERDITPTAGPYAVNFLRKAEALKMQRLVEGYIIALEQKISCQYIRSDKLASMLIELGKS